MNTVARIVVGRLLLAGLLTGGAPTGLAAFQTELAPNGSFETDANRDGAPDDWQPAAYRSPAVLTWDRGLAHSGTASVCAADSAHATDTAWDTNSGRWVQPVRQPVTAGRSYSVAAWIRTDLTAGQASVTLAWFGAGKWLAETSAEPVTGRQDWVRRAGTFPAPATADEVAVYLCLSRAHGRAWFDDVTLVEGDRFPADLQPLDLRTACNTGFRDDRAGDGTGGWTDQGTNDARELPVGPQAWRGIPFTIVDPATNNGQSCMVLQGRDLPGRPATASLTVGRAADVLYILHACAHAGPDGTAAGRYTVTYADGRTTDVPLRSGHEVMDWWRPRDSRECAVGWRGGNAQSGDIGLVVFPWANPRPEVAIDRLTAVSAGPTGPALILVAVTTGNGPAVLASEPRSLGFTDTSGWYEWAFSLDDPSLGELDLHQRLDAPAGRHGFVTVTPDGHLAFQDGTRARFVGTNVGGTTCAPEKALAERVARQLAAYGVNLLRLHTPDSRWAQIIDYSKGNSRTLDPQAMDRYDYFVDQLEKNGIYVYFDLLDYRSFLEGDGVRDAARLDTHWENSIKAASIFDRRMIELQKEYATQLLTHLNPYTGKRYVDDPALVLQEITNENSLFYLSNPKLVLPSYLEDLRQLWNRWLVTTYGDRRGLAEAWTNAGNECALGPDEDPARAAVAFPVQALYDDLRAAPYTGDRSPARLNTITRFLYETEIAYYREMTGHLRGLGLKCPITGTNQDFSDASNRANAECDVTTRNNYWCHPNLNAKPHIRFSNAPMVRSALAAEANPVSNVCSSSVVGKPLIVPEFNHPWPNEWRAEGLPVMAAYSRLQDWDGLLYFAYSPAGSGRDRLEYFGNQSDPVRWGQMPMAALLVHRGDIAAARITVHVGVSAVDLLATRPRRTSDRYSPYRILPFISKVRTAYFDTAYTGDADVVMASGHSASGDYTRARRAVVFADSPYLDPTARTADRGWSARCLVPGLQTRPGTAPCDTEIDPASVPAGMDTVTLGGRPVGVVGDRVWAVPCASLGDQAGSDWLHRTYLELATRWHLPGQAPSEEAGRVFRSDTGELVLDSRRGVFTAAAPRVALAVGFLRETEGPLSLGPVTVACRSPFASISLISLDDQPLGESRRLLLTAVARSENTGQAYATRPGSAPTTGTVPRSPTTDADTGALLANDRSALAEAGRTPIRVEPVDADVSLVTRLPLRAFALGPSGQRRTEIPTTHNDTRLVVPTRDAHSPWLLLTAE